MFAVLVHHFEVEPRPGGSNQQCDDDEGTSRPCEVVHGTYNVGGCGKILVCTISSLYFPTMPILGRVPF